MKNKNILTVAIDEPSEYSKECDLCFYPPHATIDKSEYKGKVFQGVEYVILRPEFYEKFEKTKNGIPNILVMMGGTDVYNLTLPVIKELDNYNEEFKISVILSNSHKDIKILNEFIKTANHKIKIYNKIDNMSSFLNSVDFAISQFGTVVYEYLAKNIPSIYIHNKKESINNYDYFIKNRYALLTEINSIDIQKLFNLSYERLEFTCRIYDLITKVDDEI